MGLLAQMFCQNAPRAGLFVERMQRIQPKSILHPSYLIDADPSPCSYIHLSTPIENSHYTDRKFLTFGEVAVYSFSRWTQDRDRPVKRRRAMQECTPPRNSRKKC